MGWAKRGRRTIITFRFLLLVLTMLPWPMYPPMSMTMVLDLFFLHAISGLNPTGDELDVRWFCFVPLMTPFPFSLLELDSEPVPRILRSLIAGLDGLRKR